MALKLQGFVLSRWIILEGKCKGPEEQKNKIECKGNKLLFIYSCIYLFFVLFYLFFRCCMILCLPVLCLFSDFPMSLFACFSLSLCLFFFACVCVWICAGLFGCVIPAFVNNKDNNNKKVLITTG